MNTLELCMVANEQKNWLVSRLGLTGERSPSEPEDVGEVALMLATPESGDTRNLGSPGTLLGRAREAEQLLWAYKNHSWVVFVDSGRRKPEIRLPVAKVWAIGRGIETLEQEVHRKKLEQAQKADRADIATDTPIYQLSPDELLKVRTKLMAAGFWPSWADIWCNSTEGVRTNPLEPSTTPMTGAIKRAILEKEYQVSRGGASLEWKSAIADMGGATNLQAGERKGTLCWTKIRKAASREHFDIVERQSGGEALQRSIIPFPRPAKAKSGLRG